MNFSFQSINNEVEYEAIIVDLEIYETLEANNVTIHNDSHVLVNQINGEFEVKKIKMAKYLVIWKVKVQIDSKRSIF